MKTPNCLPCFKCGRSLFAVGDEKINQPYDAVAFSSPGNYGSTVWDEMDNAIKLEIAICDNCLVEHENRTRRVYYRTTIEVIEEDAL